MQNENVIVMGSKFGAKLPELKASKIYTANAAADFGKEYKSKIQNNCEHIAVFGRDEFLKNPIVNKKIIDSKPNRLVIRNCKFDILNYFSHEPKVIFISPWKNLFIQSNFIKGGMLRIILEDFLISEKKGFFKFLQMFLKKGFQGFSTGFFCLLLARIENPNANIFFSGIGLSAGGGYFYSSSNDKGFFSNSFNKTETNTFRNKRRKLIDIALFKNLKQKKIINFHTNDKEFIQSQNKIINKNYIKYYEN